MRRALALPLSLLAFLATSATSAPRARAADADLPSGDEPPRLRLTALVDGYFAYHFTPPKVGTDAASFTTAATRHDEFAINLASVGARLEHARFFGALALQAGTSVEALYPAAAPNAPTGLALGPEVYKHVQQAYAGYRAGDFTFALGLFPSGLGVESFETTRNWSYMKTFQADLTPYFLEGAKVTWRAMPSLKITAGVDNGWQTHGHVRTTPSFTGRIDWAAAKGVDLFYAAHVGKESQGRWLGDVRFYDVLAAQLDFGKRIGAVVQAWSMLQGSDKAYGASLSAKWGFVERAYGALRGEYFKDDKGMLFEGLGAPLVPASNDLVDGATFEAGTLTLGWLPHESFVVKLEGTYRHANRQAFYGDSVPVGALQTRPIATEKQSITALLSAAFTY